MKFYRQLDAEFNRCDMRVDDAEAELLLNHIDPGAVEKMREMCGIFMHRPNEETQYHCQYFNDTSFLLATYISGNKNKDWNGLVVRVFVGVSKGDDRYNKIVASLKEQSKSTPIEMSDN